MVPPFDMITFSMPALSEDLQYKLGMLSSITFYYQNIAIKVLASETSIADRNFILDKLQFLRMTLKELNRFIFYFLKNR